MAIVTSVRCRCGAAMAVRRDGDGPPKIDCSAGCGLAASENFAKRSLREREMERLRKAVATAGG